MPSDPTANAAGAAALVPAPVAPITAAPAPVAPVAPGTTVIGEATPPDTSQTFKSAQEMISASPDDLAKRYALPADEPVIDEAPAVEGAAPATDPAAAADVAPVAEAPAASSTPVIEPITKFSLSDDEGELEIPMNVKLTFEAQGREYKDLRIDQVVRMAKQVPVLAQEAAAAKQAGQQQIAQLQQELQSNNSLSERLLSDPAFYQEAAARFQAMNSPEQRFARLEHERAAQTEQLQQHVRTLEFGNTVAAAEQYATSRIVPSIQALTTQYGLDPQDVADRFHALTAPLLVARPDGRAWVDPQRLGEIETAIIPQLTAWAQAKASQQSQRVAAGQAAARQEADTAKAQTRQAQLAAQNATRRAARPLTPLGNAPAADVPKPKPIKTSGDAIDAALMRVQQQIAQAGAA